MSVVVCDKRPYHRRFLKEVVREQLIFGSREEAARYPRELAESVARQVRIKLRGERARACEADQPYVR